MVRRFSLLGYRAWRDVGRARGLGDRVAYHALPARCPRIITATFVQKMDCFDHNWVGFPSLGGLDADKCSAAY